MMRPLLVIGIILLACAVDGLSLARDKRQQGCSRDEFKCKSGECISEDLYCDGAKDCSDASDETVECSSIKCQSFLFRCAYGACINKDLECDGKADCADNSDEKSPKCAKNNAGSTTQTNKCGKFKFACNSGECIDDLDVCDGIAGCSDSSDESADVCATMKCPKYAFQCAYGACIKDSLRCNGARDCIDGSDEVACKNGNGGNKKPATTTTTKRPVTVTSSTKKPTTKKPSTTMQPSSDEDCMLPAQIENGKWQVLNGGNRFKPGDSVTPLTIIQFECSPGWKLEPAQNNSFCLGGGLWSVNPLPKCIMACSSIQTSATLIAECDVDGYKASCTNPIEGTRAFLKCPDFYVDPTLTRNPYRYCRDGSWDYALPKCEPACGWRNGEPQKLAINATNAKRGEFPWQIGIYYAQNREHFCGGSILTPKMSLTAAHCFVSNNSADYLIAAGKYYRTYDDVRDKEVAQYTKISHLIKHASYDSNPYNAFDIALLIHETPLTINKYVLPVCLDTAPGFDYATLLNKKGIVTGWGYTQVNSAPSEELKMLEVDYKSEDACELPSEFMNYYKPWAPDKLCAGLLNEGKSACQGDSGGGLVFPDNTKVYYVRGIVSNAPRKGNGCDSNSLTLYTDVAAHIRFILDNKSKYKA